MVPRTKSLPHPKCYLFRDGVDLVIVFGDLAIAKRGRAGTPQAKTWVPLVPGFHVQDVDDGKIIEVRFEVAVADLSEATIH
jgi:hypothetical protein